MYGFDQLTVVEHPLVQHKMSMLRKEKTGQKEFRELIEEITMLIAYEATRGLALRDVQIKTPVAPAMCRELAGRKQVIIPILRAGLGMVSGLLTLMPNVKVGHLGMYRDHDTLQPVPYYQSFPKNLDEREIIMLDPMLATGGSAIAAADFIKQNGGKHLHMMCIVAARAGVEALTQAHPDIKITAAAFDEELTPNAYITPGLGDAGDRLFGTL